MSTLFRKNSKVEWKWLGRKIQGVVEKSYKESVTKTIKTKKITRHGSEQNPAYLVKSDAGNFALKLHSELAKPGTQKPSVPKPSDKSVGASKTRKTSGKSTPKMFA